MNGSFTPWTGWSACTTSCGFGTRTRYRNCTNPPPLFGGSDCLGPLHQMKECENASKCPGDNTIFYLKYYNFKSFHLWLFCCNKATCTGFVAECLECWTGFSKVAASNAIGRLFTLFVWLSGRNFTCNYVHTSIPTITTISSIRYYEKDVQCTVQFTGMHWGWKLLEKGNLASFEGQAWDRRLFSLLC